MNGLGFNPKKCKSLAFSNSNTINNEFYICDELIDSVNSHKDLGIIFDSNLTFDLHIDYVISRAKRNLFFIKNKCKMFTKIDTCITLYNLLVKSILMYGSVIWHPCNKDMIYKLEKVQNQFLKFISFKTSIHECFGT